MKKSSIRNILITGLLLSGFSCTKLDESDLLYDKVDGTLFGKNGSGGKFPGWSRVFEPAGLEELTTIFH
jgi:hypothetical protein